MNVHKTSFQYGPHTVSIETGRLARQADGSVLVSMGDTVVLVTAVGRREAQPGKDFFPLTVNYIEKTYAAGRIPGGFFKREGRPSEKETLISRLIDRPIRPLFPEFFFNEVQVVATVVSLDPEIDSDIPAMIGASAALALSGIPFKGPIGGARVGYIDGKYALNPSTKDMKTSDLDLVVAGTADAVLMVESEANLLSEAVMLGAVVYGHEQMQVAINAIRELAAKAGKPSWDWKAPELDADLAKAVAAQAEAELVKAYQITEKQARHTRVGELKKALVEALATRRRRQVPARARSPTNSAASNTTSCVAASSRASRASTAATCTRCARSPSRRACCRARTVRRCSRAAKRRRWSRPRSAPAATRRSSTRWPASAKSRSCCTTTSRRSRWARRA